MQVVCQTCWQLEGGNGRKRVWERREVLTSVDVVVTYCVVYQYTLIRTPCSEDASINRTAFAAPNASEIRTPC